MRKCPTQVCRMYSRVHKRPSGGRKHCRRCMRACRIQTSNSSHNHKTPVQTQRRVGGSGSEETTHTCDLTFTLKPLQSDIKDPRLRPIGSVVVVVVVVK